MDMNVLWSHILEEWKSSKKVEPWHVAQLAVYFILIEEHYGVRPPYGVIVLRGGGRRRVENTREFRERVFAVTAWIREPRGRLEEEIEASPMQWQCRVCGQRNRCSSPFSGERTGRNARSGQRLASER